MADVEELETQSHEVKAELSQVKSKCEKQEVKCPYSKREVSPEEVCNDPTFFVTWLMVDWNLISSSSAPAVRWTQLV